MSERDNENTTKSWRAAFWYPYERFDETKCKASEEKQSPCRGKWGGCGMCVLTHFNFVSGITLPPQTEQNFL